MSAPSKGRSHPSTRDLLSRYKSLPWGTKFFLYLRWLWTPYVEMASLMPRQGRILDGGSGHGLLSLTLALRSKARKVEGVDHSVERIAAARAAGAGLRNLSFRNGDFTSLPKKAFEGIAFIDVLHYLPYRVQERLLKDSFQKLRRHGMLLFRDVDRRPGLTSFLNRLHESIMTGLGFTKAGGLHFRTGPEWEKLAAAAGFQVRSKPTGRFPFADVLFWCRKP